MALDGRLRRGRGQPHASAGDAAVAVRGADHEIFSHESVAALHEAVSDSLLEIDWLASAMLRETAHRKHKPVDGDTLARVVESLTWPNS